MKRHANVGVLIVRPGNLQHKPAYVLARFCSHQCQKVCVASKMALHLNAEFTELTRAVYA